MSFASVIVAATTNALIKKVPWPPPIGRLSYHRGGGAFILPPRDEAQKGERSRACAGRNRRTLNGDIGYPCLFSLCFQLPLPAGAVMHPHASPGPLSRRKAKDEKRNELGESPKSGRKGEAVTGVAKKKKRKLGSLSYQPREKPLCDMRAGSSKNTGRNKNIDRGAGSFNFAV